MKIELSEISDTCEWESDLNRFEPSPFITPQWLEAVRNPTRIPVYLNVRLANETVGKMAGLKIEASCFRKRHLFFYSPPCVHDSNREITGLIINELVKYAVTNRFNRLIVRSYDSPSVFASNNKEFEIITDDEYIIDLTQSMEEIQKGFHRRSSRLQVKKAQKNGAVFYEGRSPDLIDKLVLLLNKTRSIRLSKGYEDYSYFYLPYMEESTLHKTLENGLASIFYVKIGDSISCIIFALTYGKRAYAALIGTSSKGYQLGLPAFMNYFTMKRLKELGFESYNLGGVPDDSSKSKPGLIFFKTSLGAKRFSCMGGSTNYLKFPFKCLNPLLEMGRRMPESPVKKIV
ncbi:MAG TPA: GNAT family N-acetyltransferase [Nitrospirae bacterium]|nr:GNAT family N-acetyltransferase [Nitrospirota bacterium]